MVQKATAKTSAFAVLCAVLVAIAVGPSEAKVSQGAIDRAWERLSETTGFNASLHLEEKDETNAYITIENGAYKVVVFRGLLNVLETEDEIAGVLAHEMGHGIHGHLESAMKRNAGIGLLSVLLNELLDNDTVEVAIGLGATLAVQGYSREQEVEADDAGVEYAYKAGYSAWSLYNAIERMADNGQVTSPSGFNSHPPTERRMTRLAAQAEGWEKSYVREKRKSKLPEKEAPKPKAFPVDGFDPNGSDQAKVISTYPIENGLKNVLGIIQRDGYGKYSSGRYKEAAASFARGVDSYDGNYLAALWAARAYHRAGRKDEARRWVDLALSINEDYRPAKELKEELKP